MKKESLYKEEDIMLKNFVNKLVAVELINKKLFVNSPYNKNNIMKLQKKFKKK